MDSDIENEEPLTTIKDNGPLSGGKSKRKPSGDELGTRKRRRTDELISSVNEEEEEEDVLRPLPQVRFRRVLRHIPQDIPYIPITTESGSRLYLRVNETKDKDKDNEEQGSRRMMTTEDGGNRRLFPNWEEIKEAARVLKDNFHEKLGKIVENENIVAGLRINKQEMNNNENLWVEKYKPKSYLDLLSEEGINKTLLHWIKLWDKSVFGSDFLAKVKLTKEKYAKLEAQEKEKFEKFKKFHSSKAKASSSISGSIDEGYDDMGRPKVKVALLYGPPGLGKTTCAHVIARHAGYNVREMNASDDRSVEAFKKVLDDALQSKAESFTGGRPNCLIIDEIDGAPVATVQILVELITGNATEKGKKKLKKVLKRPVICICNDLFAPSLKELKKHSLIVQFAPVTIQSLAARLNEISLKEKLYLDTYTLQSLCEKSDCDIRSCLSTLQFLKKKKCTPQDALFSQIGLKDKAKGVFEVWNEVFMIPEGKKKSYEFQDPTKPHARLKNVLKVVQSYGEYERLLSGVFENYLRVKFKECYFESVIEGLDWASWFLDLQESVNHHQNYVLGGYLPLYFVKCHFLYGQRSRFKINFPSSELSMKVSRSSQVINSIVSDIQPGIGRYLDSHDVVTDLFPALAHIIQPSSIRPVPTQIWTPRERETLRNIVEVMLGYNLSYTQLKNVETGMYNFILEPDITSLAKFNFQESFTSKQSFPYAVKQLVARELETERLRRSDTSSESQTQPMDSETQPTEEFKVPKVLPSRVKKVDLLSTVSKDFFGRIIQPTEQSKDSEAQKRKGIYLRYKEGYNNAVRRFVKMKDLM